MPIVHATHSLTPFEALQREHAQLQEVLRSTNETHTATREALQRDHAQLQEMLHSTSQMLTTTREELEAERQETAALQKQIKQLRAQDSNCCCNSFWFVATSVSVVAVLVLGTTVWRVSNKSFVPEIKATVQALIQSIPSSIDLTAIKKEAQSLLQRILPTAR